MKSAKSKRQLTLLTLVVALGVAVYLNWEYAKTDSPYAVQPTAIETSADATEDANDALDAQETAATSQPVMEALPDKNYGEAQLVSADASGGDAYFEQARLNRSKTRDEALDQLQKSLAQAQLSQEEKDAATEHLTAMIDNIAVESDIENIVKAKGFADCVAFIDGQKVNLAVKTGNAGLTENEVAQIRDIILGKVETTAQNISVVEVK